MDKIMLPEKNLTGFNNIKGRIKNSLINLKFLNSLHMSQSYNSRRSFKEFQMLNYKIYKNIFLRNSKFTEMPQF